MAICSQCTASLEKVCPLGPHNENETAVVLPRHSDDTAHRCWICCKLSKWLQEEHQEEFLAWQDHPLKIRVHRANMLLAFPETGVELSSLTLHLLPGHTVFPHGCPIEIFFIPSRDYAKVCLPALDCPPHVESNDWIAHQWILRCSTEHHKCKVRWPGKWYPTRLLLLESEGRTMRLIHTISETPDAPYITLSHRWGEKVNYETLSSATMDRFRKSIILADLPQAFQDAIAFTHRIGIKYMWIDALCIKQNDEHDWDVEAQQMHKVYAHAFLNISATLSKNGEEALFGERQLGPFQPSPLTLKMLGNLRQYHIVDGSMWLEDIEEAPLQTRGWVFQERFLATRVLHFGERQLGWECNEVSSLQLFPNGLPFGFVPTRKADILSGATSTKHYEQCDMAFRQAWADIVAMYSICDLTRPSDKLVAFSGVAKMIEEAIGAQYIAGFWRSTMIYDLAWRRASNDVIDKPYSATCHRAPSWSWLSVDGEVFLPSSHGGPTERFAEVTKYPTSDLAGTSVISARGSLELKGLMLPLISVTWKQSSLVSSFVIADYCFLEGISHMESHLDIEGTEDDVNLWLEKGVQMVPLFASKICIFAIVLARFDGSSYRRIGACQIEYQALGRTRSETYSNSSNREQVSFAENGGTSGYVRNVAADGLFEFIKEQCLAGEGTLITVI